MLDNFVTLYTQVPIKESLHSTLYRPLVGKLEYLTLLAQAAAAAQLPDASVAKIKGISWFAAHIKYRNACGNAWSYMNPIASSAEARQIAERLGLVMCPTLDEKRVGCRINDGQTEVWVGVEDGDTELALRLAIVRSAAASLNLEELECAVPTLAEMMETL